MSLPPSVFTPEVKRITFFDFKLTPSRLISYRSAVRLFRSNRTPGKPEHNSHCALALRFEALNTEIDISSNASVCLT